MYHWTFGGGELQSTIFPPLFELYQSEYHCYSKCFRLVLFGGTRHATSAVSRRLLARQASRWVDESEWGGEVECPLSASMLWSSGCQAAAPLPPGLHLTSPQSGKKAAPPRLGQSRLSATHTRAASPTGARHHSTLLSSCPPPSSLSSLTQRSL